MDKEFEALKGLGAGDFEHLNRTLITHLKGTRAILNSWGANSILCDFGLYHAAYGTDGFNERIVSLEQRIDIAILIGKEAEALVYLYCSCDRGYIFPKLGLSENIEFKDRFSGREFLLPNKKAKLFCELTVANEMELVLAFTLRIMIGGQLNTRLFPAMKLLAVWLPLARRCLNLLSAHAWPWDAWSIVVEHAKAARTGSNSTVMAGRS